VIAERLRVVRVPLDRAKHDGEPRLALAERLTAGISTKLTQHL
jgi:hypothetical protein